MFDRLYDSASETERKELMQAFIESIDIYPEKPDNGIWIKNIQFVFPIPMNGKDIINLSLEDQQTLESIVLLEHR
ncbi:MAG: recombinase family protein, partial [Solobacterium sp.]|nr:recombinase family protein [Solobacterium sp.]